MARKLIDRIGTGKTEVRIYRDVEWQEYVVKEPGMTAGDDQGYFTSDRDDAYSHFYTRHDDLRGVVPPPVAIAGIAMGYHHTHGSHHFETFHTSPACDDHGGVENPARPDCHECAMLSGWYWWSCMPGCMPDSEAFGPFESEDRAIEDAEGCSDDADADAVRRAERAAGWDPPAMRTSEGVLVVIALLLALVVSFQYWEARWCDGPGAGSDTCVGCTDDCLE